MEILVTRSRINSMTTGTLNSCIHTRAWAMAEGICSVVCTHRALQPRPCATVTCSPPYPSESGELILRVVEHRRGEVCGGTGKYQGLTEKSKKKKMYKIK